LTYFHNSKAIKFLNSGEEMKAEEGEGQFEISEVLMELDFVKRELYEQIDYNWKVFLEKEQVKEEFKDLEI
jgi:hypothetical protein